MASIFEFITGKGQEKAVHSALVQLDRQKTILRLEIENTQIRFNTVIALRKGGVVVAKPEGIDQHLKSGVMVRFKVPGENHDIRMEIQAPHFNLGNGSPVFICIPPTKFSPTSNRSTERFATGRFTNVNLHIDSLSSKFKILDLSGGGCRILTNHQHPLNQFPVGSRIEGAFIQLGNKARIDLAYVIPRSHRGQNIGLEFHVREDGPHGKMLDHMVKSLEKQQRETLRASHM